MTAGNITVSINTEIIEEARKKNINISQAAEEGIRAACGGRITGILHKPSKVERALTAIGGGCEIRLDLANGGNTRHFSTAIKLFYDKSGIKLTEEEFHDLLNKLKERKP